MAAIAIILVAAVVVAAGVFSQQRTSSNGADRTRADRDTVSPSAKTALDVEVPSRITHKVDPHIVLSTFVTAFQNTDYQPPLSNRELVAAGLAVCAFFDEDAPGARRDEAGLLAIAEGVLSDSGTKAERAQPIRSTLQAWLRAAPTGTGAPPAGQRAALASVSTLARGAVVSFCPEHLGKVSRPRP